jgi:hypothetical protein
VGVEGAAFCELGTELSPAVAAAIPVAVAAILHLIGAAEVVGKAAALTRD